MHYRITIFNLVGKLLAFLLLPELQVVDALFFFGGRYLGIELLFEAFFLLDHFLLIVEAIAEIVYAYEWRERSYNEFPVRTLCMQPLQCAGIDVPRGFNSLAIQ